MTNNILVMGAKIEALKARINCMERYHKINDKIFLLGNDPWPFLTRIKYPCISGENTINTLRNYKRYHPYSINSILIISGWYHLLRCWLILRTLGFQQIKLVPSTWKLWETPWKTIISELQSLRGFYFG